MDEYVNYIINKLGDSQSATGIQAYSLDNEPALWSHTHSRIHPQPVGIKELSDKSIEMAAAVKKLDPNADIFGPALYGYTAYDHLADDDESTEWEEIKSANNYNWYMDLYLLPQWKRLQMKMEYVSSTYLISITILSLQE